MHFISRAIFPALLASLALVSGCDRSSSSTTPEPDAEPSESEPQEEYVPEPTSDWGEGKVSGLVKLAWGAPVPEGSKLRLSLWHNADVVKFELIEVSGPGPWAFELAADDTSAFQPEDIFGLGVMIEVPPDGEAWYMTRPPTTQIWQHGVEHGPVELGVVAIDKRVSGEGEPPF